MKQIIVFLSIILLCFIFCVDNKTKKNNTEQNEKSTTDSNNVSIEEYENIQDSMPKINIFSIADKWHECDLSKIGAMIFFVDSTHRHTMFVVTDGQMTDCPFQISNIQQFRQKYKYFIEDDIIIRNDEMNLIDTVNKFIYKDSFVKLYYNKEEQNFDIVSALIKDMEIRIIYDIHVGLSKDEFFEKIFHESSKYDFSDVNIFSNNDSRGEVEQNFIFEDDKLKIIEMKSAYNFLLVSNSSNPCKKRQNTVSELSFLSCTLHRVPCTSGLSGLGL
jgi:hypothetical protein